MRVKIHSGKAHGFVQAPPSKSMAHRYLIAAALAEGKSVIRGIAFSQDILATIDCLRGLGVSVAIQDDAVIITGGGSLVPMAPLHCRESGSTLRFMIPLCLLSGEKAVLRGSDRLMERPQTVYRDLCKEHGFFFEQTASSVSVQGTLSAGVYTLDGGISSQFITGMLFALSKAEGESILRLVGKVESRSYIDLTLSALRRFGFCAHWIGNDAVSVVGGKGCAVDCTVEGDYSNAAFFEALNLLGGSVSVRGLEPDSLQGDRVYQEYFQVLSAGTPTLSLADCPDLGPILFAMAAACNGAVFTDTARLKIKESDRGAAMAEELQKCGVTLTLEENSVTVPSVGLIPPSEAISGHNDHRIVMAMAVLLTRLGGEIQGAQAVAKSMPDFFERLSLLGIEVIKDEAE